MVDLFQDDWLSNLIGWCSIPEHKKKKKLISSFVCGWLQALCIRLGSFKSEQPFDPVRNLPLSASRETMLTAREQQHHAGVQVCQSPQKPSWESKKFSMTPGRLRNLPGETGRQKCVLKSKTHFLPLWPLFSLELILHLPAPKYY